MAASRSPLAPEALQCLENFEPTYDVDTVKTLIIEGKRPDALRKLLPSPRDFLRKKGVDPSRVTFVLTTDAKNFTQPAVILTTRVDGMDTLRIILRQGDSDYAEGHFLTLTRKVEREGTKEFKDERHRGLGIVSYLVAARTLYKEYGMKMASDIMSPGPFNSVTPEAQAVWGRIRSMGLADNKCPHHMECYSYFKESALQSEDLSAFDHFTIVDERTKGSD